MIRNTRPALALFAAAAAGCGSPCGDQLEWPVENLTYPLEWAADDLHGTVRLEDHQVIIDYARADGTEWTVVYEIHARVE